jgi:hypothetical protein
MKSPAWRRRAFQGGKCGVIQGSPVHADNFEQRPTFHGSASVANATAQGNATHCPWRDRECVLTAIPPSRSQPPSRRRCQQGEVAATRDAALGAGARHKATNLCCSARVLIRPHYRRTEAVRLGYQSLVGHDDPLTF